MQEGGIVLQVFVYNTNCLPPLDSIVWKANSRLFGELRIQGHHGVQNAFCYTEALPIAVWIII